MTTSYTDELVSLVLDSWRGQVESVLAQTNPLIDIYGRFNAKQGIKTPWRLPSQRQIVETSSGLKFTFPTRIIALARTKKLGSVDEQFTPQYVKQVVRAEYNVEQITTDIALYDKHIDACQDDSAVVDLVNEKVEGAIEDHVNVLSGTYMWAAPNSTEPSPCSLPQICHEGSSNTQITEYMVGGIVPSVAAYAAWACQIAVVAAFHTANEGIRKLGILKAQVAAKGGQTHVHICNSTAYGEYLETAFGRIQTGKTSDDFWGYPTIEGAPVVIDENAYNQDTLASWYGLDLRHVGWFVLKHKKVGNKPAFCLPIPAKDLPFQLGSMYVILTEGAFCCLKRNTQFHMGITLT